MKVVTAIPADLIEEFHGQGVHVIVVSGYTVPLVPQKAVAAFLQKPFSGNDLITTQHATVSRLP